MFPLSWMKTAPSASELASALLGLSSSRFWPAIAAGPSGKRLFTCFETSGEDTAGVDANSVSTNAGTAEDDQAIAEDLVETSAGDRR